MKKLDQALGSTPAALLAGNNEAMRAFSLSDKGAKDGLEWLEALPRDKEGSFERIRMGFGRSGLEVMELFDSFGQTTVLRFGCWSAIPSWILTLSDSPPKGADVIGDVNNLSSLSKRMTDLFPRLRRCLRWRKPCGPGRSTNCGAGAPPRPGKPLRLAFDSGKPHSMIRGTPESARRPSRLMADAFDAQFIAIRRVFRCPGHQGRRAAGRGSACDIRKAHHPLCR